MFCMTQHDNMTTKLKLAILHISDRVPRAVPKRASSTSADRLRTEPIALDGVI